MNWNLQEIDGTVASHFEHAVECHKLNTALGAGSWRPTYEELNVVANRLAHALLSRGGAPGDRIAVLMEPDSPSFGAVLGAIKAGRIVVVLNTTDPPARLRQLIEDAEPALIVTDRANGDIAAEIARPGCGIVFFETEGAAGPTHNPSIEIGSDQTFALVYTSGTTGRPKGVMMTHRRILHAIAVDSEFFDFDAGDKIPILGPLSYGAPFTRSWRVLLNGATLYSYPVTLKATTGLAEWIVDHGMTVYLSSASIFRAMMKSIDENVQFSSVHTVVLSAEPATADDFMLFKKHFSATCTFIHTFASTEAGHIAISRRSSSSEVPEGRLSVGPISGGMKVLFLDEQNKPVADGEIGEIVVKSRGLAAGYWRNPALTAERFSDPSEGDGTRLFHTGDLGRINSEGVLEFVGRKDRRAKVRGNLIELTEVEDSLRRLPDITHAAVEVIRREHHEDMLVGYVVPANDQSWSPSRLRAALRDVLPTYMVPSRIVLLDALPVTPNGKIDREKLRELAPPLLEGNEAGKPTTDTETRLVSISENVFEVASVGRDDDFFDLGGNSLIAAVIGSEVQKQFGVELSLKDFADFPVLADLAAAVDRLGLEGGYIKPPLVRASREGPLPMSSFQERMWKYSQTEEENAQYTVVSGFRIHGPLNTDVFQECINYIAERHEILRANYSVVDGKPVQVVHPPEFVPVPVIDLTGAENPESEMVKYSKNDEFLKMNLARGPLMRLLLFRLSESEYLLLRALHHVIWDGSSGELYFKELGVLYEARLRGEEWPLPALAPFQYADYAAWHREVFSSNSPAYKKAVEWWERTLSGVPPVFRLPVARDAPATGVAPSEGLIQWGVAAEVSERLNALGRMAGATPYMVRLAGFAALLALKTGERDVVMGTYVTNRNYAPVQNMFGMFVNLAILRFRFDAQSTFREWVSIVRSIALEAESHSEIPFEELCGELRQRGITPPDIQLIFGMSAIRDVRKFGGLQINYRRLHETMPWGFTVHFNSDDEENRCRVTFNANIYDPARARALLDQYEQVLEAVSRDPDIPLERLLTGLGST